MELIRFFFQSSSCLLGLLTAGILLWANSNASQSKQMLIFLLLALTAVNLNGALYYNDMYLIIPWFHRATMPISFLIAPLSYLYIRSVLLTEYKFRKYDWMILLPTLLAAISLLPYYMMPLDEKKNYLAELVRNNLYRVEYREGILPPFLLPFFRVAWSLLFIILNHKLIRQFKRRSTKKELSDNVSILQWLTILNLMLTIILALSLIATVISTIVKNDYFIGEIAMGVFVFVVCVVLFAKPKILYGVYLPVPAPPLDDALQIENPHTNPVTVEEKNNNSTELTVKETTESGISQADAHNYKIIVENFFRDSRPFLKPEYILDNLASDLQTSRYTLSAFINREYNMGFREFLNRYRIEYMIANLNKPEWEHFTLEAISEECGFSSRTTFIKNFKEVTGQTPSAYVKNNIKIK